MFRAVVMSSKTSQGPRLLLRRAYEQVFVYGRQPVLEILKAGKRTLHKIWLLEGTGGDIIQEIQNVARVKGVPFELVRREHLGKRARPSSRRRRAGDAA